MIRCGWKWPFVLTGVEGFLVHEAVMPAHPRQQLLVGIRTASLAGIGLQFLTGLHRRVAAATLQDLDQSVVPGYPRLGLREHVAQAGKYLHAGVVEVAKEA